MSAGAVSASAAVSGILADCKEKCERSLDYPWYHVVLPGAGWNWGYRVIKKESRLYV